MSTLTTPSTAVAQNMKPPNVGYMPYWHGYTVGNLWNLPTQPMRDGERLVQWDYGLDVAGGVGGRAVYLPGITPLLEDDAQLGAGAALRDEADYIGWERPNVSVLLGPTGMLGPGPNDYSNHLLNDMKAHTSNCRQCSEQDKNVGTVCVIDKNGQYREMSRCMMLQMNCLRGTAVSTSSYARHHVNQIYVPQDRWARVSVMGQGHAWILLSETLPPQSDGLWMGYSCMPNYMFGLYAYRGDNIFYKHTNPAYYLKDYSLMVHKFWCQTVYYNQWREYSIVWQENGNVTLAESRPGRRRPCPALTDLDRNPFQINYISVAGWEGFENTIIVHDLLKDLQQTAVGKCQLGEVRDFPEDTEEVFKLTNENEAKYQERMKRLQRDKGIAVNDARWRPQEGSDAEY